MRDEECTMLCETDYGPVTLSSPVTFSVRHEGNPYTEVTGFRLSHPIIDSHNFDLALHTFEIESKSQWIITHVPSGCLFPLAVKETPRQVLEQVLIQTFSWQADNRINKVKEMFNGLGNINPISYDDSGVKLVRPNPDYGQPIQWGYMPPSAEEFKRSLTLPPWMCD